MAAHDTPQSLLSYVRKYGNIPEEGCGNPWCKDGNIFLFTNDMAFKFYMGLLRDNAPRFKERLQNLSDDSVDVVQNHPAIQVDDSSEDLGYFLEAISGVSGREFPLESDLDFIELSAILRLATKYGSKPMRENAIQALQKKFPSSLSGWDLLAENATFRQWNCDPVLVINLSRKVRAFSLMPAAMATLSNNASAGEVFGVPVHEGTRQRNSFHALKAPEDIIGFALMKEYNHVSVVRMIDFVYEVGRDCIQLPEPDPSSSVRSPVGTRRAEHRASICSKIFHGMGDTLAVKLKREDAMGYREFSMMVWQDVMSPKRPICRWCRSRFQNGYKDYRESWWNGIPGILGLQEV